MSYLGKKPSIGSFKKANSISALQNNVRVIFPLTVTSGFTNYPLAPITPTSLLVVKNGNPLEPYNDYNVLEANIIFSGSAPLTTDDIWITTFGEPIVIGTPGEGAVTDDSFAQGSVTNDKLSQEAQDLIIGNIVTFGI